MRSGKWAKTCAEAGMQYLCFVAKHHSGFCMWDSAYTDYEPQRILKTYEPLTD